jgi:predicted nucleic acid-binding protein
MEKVFIDTDIALDLLAEREPHYPFSAALFSLADKGELTICLSSLSFSNLNYLLTRQYSSSEARRILNTFKVLVKVLAVDEKIIGLALNSGFRDLEDAIQYYTAIENGIDILLTRNIKDYKGSSIAVLSAEAYLKRI